MHEERNKYLEDRDKLVNCLTRFIGVRDDLIFSIESWKTSLQEFEDVCRNIYITEKTSSFATPSENIFFSADSISQAMPPPVQKGNLYLYGGVF